MNFIWDIHVSSFPASTEASFSLYWAGKEASANREVPSIFYSFKIHNLHARPIIQLVCPTKVCLGIVLSFSWNDCNTGEIIIIIIIIKRLCQIWGEGKQGVFYEMCQWWILYFWIAQIVKHVHISEINNLCKIWGGGGGQTESTYYRGLENSQCTWLIAVAFIICS